MALPFSPEQDRDAIARLTHPELIALLLEHSSTLTFRFTRAWLLRQSLQRLRVLLEQSREECRTRST